MEHALRVQQVAEALGMYLQFVPLFGDEEMQAICSQMVEDAESTIVD